MSLKSRSQLAAAGNDESTVTCSCCSGEHSVLEFGGHEILVAYIVAVKSEAVDLKDAFNESRSLFLHAMYVKCEEQAFGAVGKTFTPHIAHREIHQIVIVGISHLKEALAACDILIQSRSVAPYRIGGAHVDRCVEFPSRPGILTRRVGSAVIEHVVHTAGEHQVDVGLHLRQRGAEVLSEPSEGLARCERLAGDVGCRRRILQHRHIAVIGASESLIGAQTLYSEVRQSESFYFRDIDSGIEVNQICRRAMSLITGL